MSHPAQYFNTLTAFNYYLMGFDFLKAQHWILCHDLPVLLSFQFIHSWFIYICFVRSKKYSISSFFFCAVNLSQMSNNIYKQIIVLKNGKTHNRDTKAKEKCHEKIDFFSRESQSVNEWQANCHRTWGIPC